MEHVDTLEVCADCLLFVANGDLPENEEHAAAVLTGAERHPHMHAGTKELGFSWRPCQCCGSKLGGDRFDAIVLA